MVVKQHVGEIIDVYGKAQHELSKDFILELSEKLLGCSFFPFVVGGDFNLGVPMKNLMQMLIQC
jgi:hypothetical protein